MRQHAKPVRKCHSCLLNQGSHCWLYKYPRGQWREGRSCRAFEDEEAYGKFRMWQKQPNVKSRKDLRRRFHRARKRALPTGRKI